MAEVNADNNTAQEDPKKHQLYPVSPVICSRCGCSFKTVGHGTQHLQRKDPCIQVMQNMTPDQAGQFIRRQHGLLKEMEKIGISLITGREKTAHGGSGKHKKIAPLGHEDIDNIPKELYPLIHEQPCFAPFLIIPFVWGRFADPSTRNITGFSEHSHTWKCKIADPWVNKSPSDIIPFVTIVILNVMRNSLPQDGEEMDENCEKLKSFVEKMCGENPDDIRSTFTENIGSQWDAIIKTAMEYEHRAMMSDEQARDEIISKADAPIPGETHAKLEHRHTKLRQLVRERTRQSISLLQKQLEENLKLGIYGAEDNDVCECVRTTIMGLTRIAQFSHT